jgi:hypothetical protein
MPADNVYKYVHETSEALHVEEDIGLGVKHTLVLTWCDHVLCVRPKAKVRFMI